jgi:hypothetical protein
MAEGPVGSVVDEPTAPTSRRERRAAGRGGRRTAPVPTTPPAPTGRQAARARAARRQFWFVVMPAVAIALALVVLVGLTVRDDGGDGGGEAAGGSRAATRRPDTILFAHRGGDQRIDLLVMAGTDGGRGSVLLLPTGTQVEVPSLGPLALADLPADADPSLLPTTVENLLGVRVVRSVTLDDASLAAILTAAEPIPVELQRAAVFDDASGGEFPAGAHEVSGGDASRLLVSTQAGNELDRLITVQDVFDGWLTRLRTRGIAQRTVEYDPALEALVRVARANEHQTDTLPVEETITGEGGRFTPRDEDLARYIPDAFGNALLGRGVGRPRVEILNGTGAVGLAQAIAGQVVPAGAHVTLSGNVNGFGVADTQVVYYRDADRKEAQRLLASMDCGTLKKASSAIGVVDVTIIAGADCYPIGSGP